MNRLLWLSDLSRTNIWLEVVAVNVPGTCACKVLPGNWQNIGPFECVGRDDNLSVSFLVNVIFRGCGGGVGVEGRVTDLKYM